MKIVESQSAVLSNYEVLDHLNTTRLKPRTTSQKHQNVSTVIKELNDYLSPSTSDSPIPPYDNSKYSPEAIRELVTRLKPYDLKKSEMLMIVNLRPLGLELLDCVVEECDERLTVEQQEMILAIVGDVLGREEEGGEGEEEEAAGGMAEVRGD